MQEEEKMIGEYSEKKQQMVSYAVEKDRVSNFRYES